MTRRALPAFAAVSFAYFSFAGLFGTYGPLWFESLGYSALAIGTLVSLQSATRVFMPYAWAWLADHTGRRLTLLRLAIAGAALSALGFAWTPSYAWVAVVMTTLFVFTSGVMPLSEAALAQWVSRSGGALDAGRYGRVRLWGSVGFIAAVTAVGFVLERAGVRWFPWIAAIVLVALGVASLRLPEVAEAPRGDAAARGVLARLREPEVAWFFASVFLTVLAHHALYAFYSLYLAGLGYSKGTIGLIWALGVVVEVIWFAFQGRWFARLPAQGWLALAGGVTAARFALIAAFGSVPAALVLAQCTHAITFAAQHTACLDIINRRFGGPLRGRGQALYAVIGYGFSGVAAGVAGGALVEALGYAAVFWAASAAGLLAAACSLRALRARTGAMAAQG